MEAYAVVHIYSIYIYILYIQYIYIYHPPIKLESIEHGGLGLRSLGVRAGPLTSHQPADKMEEPPHSTAISIGARSH